MMREMKVTNVYDHYFRYAEIERQLRGWAEALPEYVRLVSLGSTPEGRDILMLEVTDTRTGSFDSKPAYVAAGNIHAGEVTGSMCVMYFIDWLLTNRDVPSHARLLADYTLLAIPRISPDGSEFYLTTGMRCRSVNRPYPSEQLPDGIYGEDMDGDGSVRQMRYRDPLGQWKVCPEEPRLMMRRAPDELEGEFYSVVTEGRMHGGTPRPFDAPEGYGLDLNRNFPFGWLPENKQRGAGEAPLCAPESRAIAELLASRSNICFFLTYHTCGGVMLYPPAGMPPEQVEREDTERYQALGRILQEETTYPARNIYDNFVRNSGRPNGGSFEDYIQYCRGVAAASIELWDLDVRAGLPGKWERKMDAESPELRLKYEKMQLDWVDKNIGPDCFKPWAAFMHPQLGEVEIGGYDLKYVMYNPPISWLGQEMEKCARFMFRHIMLLPRVEICSAEAVRRSDGLYEINVEIINRRFYPTYMTRDAIKQHIVNEDSVEIEVDGFTLVSGRPVERTGYLPGTSAIHTDNNFGEFMTFSPPLSKRVSWIVEGSAGTAVKINVRSDKGGTAAAVVTLP